MKLFLDTTDFDTAHLSLIDVNGQEVAKASLAAGKQLTQHLVPQIIALCLGSNKTLNQLTEVEVTTGPGSFTGTRIGVAVANALGYALNIPVNGERSVTPYYGAPPNITL